MQVIERIESLRSEIHAYRSSRGEPASVGFVPTMGYLHEGHASLLRKARADNGLVALSIFVNPLQFGPNEDFDRYPRDPEKDLLLAEREGVDLVFMPPVAEMYPAYPLASKIVVGEAAAKLCGASRPGHFDGVATVVVKLLNIVQPNRAYFGLKDAQQVAVLKQVTADLNMAVDIVPCPIVREPDGLALSSRNVYLSERERLEAAVLSSALDAAARLLESGHDQVDANGLEAELRTVIGRSQLADIDYATALSYPSLQPLPAGVPVDRAVAGTGDRQLIMALAVKFGRTRLIDNRIIRMAEVSAHV